MIHQRIARMRLKIKQGEIAKKIGMQYSNYSAIENGRLIPNNIKSIEHKVSQSRSGLVKVSCKSF